MKEKISRIKERIKNAALSYNRDPNTINLIAVSKTMGAEKVKDAFHGGCNIFGENYIQEAKIKIEELSDLPISWHFIGHLQSNKAKYAVKLFDLIHSIDSFNLAIEIDKQAAKIGKIQNILIQINIAGEAAKSGAEYDKAFSLVKEISMLNNISICGLMTMLPYFNEPEKAAPHFKSLYELSQQIDKMNINGVKMKELSMGMTGDFETAIKYGATMVRIGTALFGERIYR